MKSRPTVKPFSTILFWVFFCIPLGVVGRPVAPCTDDADPEQVKLDIQQACGTDLDCIKEHTLALLESNSCFCEQIGLTLDVYFGFGLRAHTRKVVTTCQHRYFLYPFTVASHAFQQAEFESAIDWYWDALGAGAPPSSCITNIGASYFQLGEYAFAFNCFEDAFENTELSEAEAYMVLNNLTAIQMQLSNWDDAFQWSIVAKNRLAHQLDGYDLDQMTIGNAESALIEANEWLIRIALGDIDFIESRWEGIHWGSAHLPAEQWIKLIWNTGKVLNEASFHELNIRLLKQLYTEYLSEPHPTVTFGAFTWFLDRLISTPLKSYPKAVEDWRWVEMLYSRQIVGEASETGTQQSIAKKINQNSLLTQLAWACASLLGLGYAFFRYRRNKRVFTQHEDTASALENLKNWHLGKLKDFDSVQSSLDALEKTSRQNVSGWLVSEGIELSDVELIILRHSLSNISPKQTAIYHDWTPNYVYKIRSRLRVKLNAPEGEDLNNWVVRQIKST